MMNNIKLTIFVISLLILQILAQSCQDQLESVQFSLQSSEKSLSSIKKAVKIVSIVLPILGGLLLIILGLIIFILVRLILGIKKKLPIPKTWGFIRFIRNLSKLRLKLEDGSLTGEANLESDIALKTKNQVHPSGKEEEKNKKKKSKEEEEEDKRKKKEEEEEKKKKKRGIDWKFIYRSDLEIDESQILGRGLWHISFRGKFKGEDIVYKRLAYLSTKSSNDEVEKERERREKINKLGLQFVVKFHGCVLEEEDREYGIVTKYYKRRSLYDEYILKKDSSIKFEEKMMLALNIANTIISIHKEGIVLHYISSHNVMIENENGGKLNAFLDLSFQPSCLVDLFYGKQRTYLGPVSWLAPEVIDNRKFTTSSDAFSFGVLLWELITQEEPFSDKSAVGVACPLIHKGLRLTIPETVPDSLKKMMEKCFSSKPEERPSFNEIKDTLQSLV